MVIYFCLDIDGGVDSPFQVVLPGLSGTTRCYVHSGRSTQRSFSTQLIRKLLRYLFGLKVMLEYFNESRLNHRCYDFLCAPVQLLFVLLKSREI